MSATLNSPPRLYRQLLGDAWPNLALSIRTLHEASLPLRATGIFRVTHGDSWLARLLARLARLPAAGEAVEVVLQVTMQGEHEKWLRTFAGRPLVSFQYPRTAGHLVERVGLAELYLAVSECDGALCLRTVGGALCWGRWRIPLPSWLRPSVTAWERPIAGNDQIEVDISISVPLLGRLISYSGLLICQESQ